MATMPNNSSSASRSQTGFIGLAISVATILLSWGLAGGQVGGVWAGGVLFGLVAVAVAWNKMGINIPICRSRDQRLPCFVTPRAGQASI